MTSHQPQESADDIDEVFRSFKELVNMTAHQIEKWLDTEESREVGQKKEGE